jgi:hypothetical protein
MTKLSDAIQSARRHGGRSLGFSGGSSGTSAADQPKRGLLIASVGNDAAGADVQVVLDAGSVAAATAAAVAATTTTGGAIPIGLGPATLTSDAAAASQEAGASFAVFDPATTNADALLNEELEYCVRVALDADEGQLRAIGSLRPVLIVLAALSDPLPVTEMLALRRAVMLTGAPAAVRVEPAASAPFLQSLRDSGVVALGLADPSSADVDALRARIAELPEPARKRRSDAGAVVPGVVPGQEDDDDFDD